MLKLLSRAAIREVERLSIEEEGIGEDELMLRAGTALARRAAAYLQSISAQTEQPRVTFLIGSGNNGGDGLVAGRVLAERTHAQVRFYLTRERDAEDPLLQPLTAAGHLITVARDDLRFRVLTQLIASADLVIDALYGIGATPPLRSEASKLLRAIGQALRESPPLPHTITIDPLARAPRPARPYLIACDCPSGLNADTGDIDPNTPEVDETVTFIAPKPGLYTFPGAARAGRVTIAPLGLPDTLTPLKSANTFVADAPFIAGLLPARPASSHKGTFGKVLVVGGCAQYAGAPALAAKAAYRSGAGLVTIAAPGMVINTLAGSSLETTWFSLADVQGFISADAAETLLTHGSNYDTWIIGPGMGQHSSTTNFLSRLLAGLTHNQDEAAPDHASAQSSSQASVVLDADALNILADLPEWYSLLPANTILTPHPGEMARLCGTSTREVQAARLTYARDKAKLWRCTIVLKGAHTIVASSDGRAAVLPFKNSALATAGTGDILAGLCGGFAAQRLGPFESALGAAYVHGLAGELAAQALGTERSVIAGDVLGHISQAFASLEP